MMAVPYQAAFAVTSLLLPALSKRRGHVLNVTSAASLSGFRGAVDRSMELRHHQALAFDTLKTRAANRCALALTVK